MRSSQIIAGDLESIAKQGCSVVRPKHVKIPLSDRCSLSHFPGTFSVLVLKMVQDILSSPKIPAPSVTPPWLSSCVERIQPPPHEARTHPVVMGLIVGNQRVSFAPHLNRH